MQILKTVNEQNVTLTLIGRLDTNTAVLLEDEVKELDNVHLVLNLEKLDYVSSAGLRVLLLIQKRVNNGLLSFTLENVLEDVMEVLDMTGFSTILNIK